MQLRAALCLYYQCLCRDVPASAAFRLRAHGVLRTPASGWSPGDSPHMISAHMDKEVEYGVWLLLDSRVVDLPRAYSPTFVVLPPLNPLFFNDLKNEFRFSDHVAA